MKKPLFLTVVLALMLQATSFGQSIKLNNEDDPGSAMLEVSSASKGILIPNISLTGTTDATTIASPAVSLLVYNTASLSDIIPGYYYNSGTAISPVWRRLSTGTDGQGGVTTAGSNVTITGAGTGLDPYVVNATYNELPGGLDGQVLTMVGTTPTWITKSPCAVVIGEYYAGGIVFIKMNLAVTVLLQLPQTSLTLHGALMEF
ncbi:MAG: hypothetical protein ACJA1O_003228 [Spirosomataceae bacterium]|jgi:hypothetical protein